MEYKASMQTICKSVIWRVNMNCVYRFYATKQAPNYIRQRIKANEHRAIIAQNCWEALVMLMGDLLDDETSEYVAQQIAELEEPNQA